MTRIHLMHLSMQFSDDWAQVSSDVKKVFNRARERKVAWGTGTEAGGKKSLDTRTALHKYADDYGYRLGLTEGGDSFIFIAKSMVHKGTWKEWFDRIITPSEGVGKHTGRGVYANEFDSDLGHITILTAHYLTKGRPGAKINPNLDENRELAQAIGKHARAKGEGANNLVFYGGDQNIVDRTHDTFLGQPLTSAWDELRKWENTGHGNIDVIASYDGDRRTKAIYCRALDDSEFRLFTDHFLVEAGFEVLTRG